jgi:hypothetical protein
MLQRNGLILKKFEKIVPERVFLFSTQEQQIQRWESVERSTKSRFNVQAPKNLILDTNMKSFLLDQ